MTVAAAQTAYRDELIAGFEVNKSLLLDTVTTEAVVKGNTATFLVVDSGSASAVTRGVNGQIPTRSNSSTQTSVTLVEWHDIPEMTGFNIFASQGNQRAALQRTSIGTLNRRIDYDIYTELNTGTVTIGTSQMSEALVMNAYTKLQNADVPWDRNITGLITPAAHAFLMQIDGYSNADKVELRPLPDMLGAWRDMPLVRHWAGVNWIVHPTLPGVGTSAEKCFMYHKNAIGHAMNTGGMQALIGYDEKQDISWARSSCYMGTQILQNTGVVVITHDGSAYA